MQGKASLASRRVALRVGECCYSDDALALAESFFHDSVLDLGSDFGPNIDLTFGYTLVADGSGGFGFDFAVGGLATGGAVPESSTWAMMLIGFAGLGFAGDRATRRSAAVGLRA